MVPDALSRTLMEGLSALDVDEFVDMHSLYLKSQDYEL